MPKPAPELHVYLLRHGLTDDNASGTIQGHQPTPLNAEGRRQALCLARRFGAGGIAVEALVSSDLRRALETAEPIAARLGLALTPDAAWRERGLGSWEGKTVGELGIWQAASSPLDPPGAESAAAFSARVVAAFVALVPRFPGARAIAVMTHGGPLRALLHLMKRGAVACRGRAALEPPPTIANASILHLTCAREPPHEATVLALNDVAHLAQATRLDAG